ncbi:MAG: DUF1792 domain-containing protein [Desulfuromusa sp.]|nr:DUF1792 domain-containing protein [Desulfuromusa sp.]
MEYRGSYKISRWEHFFGGDMWVLRNMGRVLILALFALIPIKKWRHALRDRFDLWMIARYHEKISHFLSQYPRVRSEVETIKAIAEKGYSIARFGDGEFNMCIGRHKSFQQYDEKLVSRLKWVLANNEPGLLIGVPTIRSEKDLTVILKKFVIRRGHRVLELLDRDRIYESATMATVFPAKSADLVSHVNLLKSIWAERKVVFVVGANSRFFYEKELFENMAQHQFIYGPARNAFTQYDDLIKQVTAYDRGWLILISLGPTATVMVYDLFKLGYQAIDLGQTPSKFHKAKYGMRYPQDHPMYNKHQ